MTYEPIIPMALSQGDDFTPDAEYVCVLPCTVVGKSSSGWHICRNGVTKLNEGELILRSELINTGYLGETLTEARILNQYWRCILDDLGGGKTVRASRLRGTAVLIITEDNSYCYAATEIDYEVGETSIYRDLSLSDLRALDLVNTETWLQHLQELAAGDVHRRRADAESQLRHAQRVLEQLDAIH